MTNVTKPATVRTSLPSTPELSELVHAYERAFEESTHAVPSQPESGIVLIERARPGSVDPESPAFERRRARLERRAQRRAARG
jgi:hypothetical protein